MIGDLLDRYEFAVFAYLNMVEDRYRTGVDPDYAPAVRWELHQAAEDLRAAGIREHELNELQARAAVKLAALHRVLPWVLGCGYTGMRLDSRFMVC